MTDTPGALSGVRVLELCGERGQYAGKLLADLGADVVKVEPPAGSPARQVGPFVEDVPDPNRSLSFWYYNTNKRSAVLDLEDERGRDALRRLAASADILLEDMPPGSLDSLDVGYDKLSQVNPRLIWTSVTPFGQSGPWRDFRTSDLVDLALGGQMMMNGYDSIPGSPPIRGGGDQGYHTACHLAVIGTLVALWARDESGEGQCVDASAHEALACTTEVAMPYYFYEKVNVIRQTGRHATARISEPWQYPTRDGKYVNIFGMPRDNNSWLKIVDWFSQEGIDDLKDPKFLDPRVRQLAAGRPEAAEMLRAIARFCAEHDAEDIYRGGQERGCAWGTVRAPEETLDDPHLWDRGFFVSWQQDDVEVTAPGPPYLLTETPWALRRPAPKLGEHTAEMLREAGMSEAEVAALARGDGK